MSSAKERVGLKEFAGAVREASENGGSCETVATKLGLKPMSVYQRLVKLNKELKAKGLTQLPTLSLKASTKRSEILEEIGGGRSEQPEQKEGETENETETVADAVAV